MVRILIVAGTALCGYFLLSRKRTGNPRPAHPPLTARQYHDRLANGLECTLAYGHRPLWKRVSAECRRGGREDLPGHMREKFPELAERLDHV